MEVGEKIKKLRTDNKMSQNELSIKSGVSESSIRKYEKGLRKPKKEQLNKIAAALNVDIEELLDSSMFLEIASNGMEGISRLVTEIADSIEVITSDAKIQLEDVKLTRTAGTLSIITEYLGLGKTTDIGIGVLEKILSSVEFKSYLEYLIFKYSKEGE